MNDGIAEKVCFAAAHAALVFVGVSLGTAAGFMEVLSHVALFTATIVALLLCVHHWNNSNVKVSISAGNENGNGYGEQASTPAPNVPVVNPPV